MRSSRKESKKKHRPTRENTDSTQEALVLTAAGGSLKYKYKAFTEAIYKVMPEGKCTSSLKTKDVFPNESTQHEKSEVEQNN